MSTKWTRNQKITVCGIVAATVVGLVGLFVKINIDISIMQNDIRELKVETADIKALKSKVANIDRLFAKEAQMGKMSSKCPPGTRATTRVSPSGLEVVCS